MTAASRVALVAGALLVLSLFVGALDSSGAPSSATAESPAAPAGAVPSTGQDASSCQRSSPDGAGGGAGCALIPEPSTMFLGGLGVMALTYAARRWLLPGVSPP